MSAIGSNEPQAQWEIIQVLQRYCRAMDRIDAELGYSCAGSARRSTGPGLVEEFGALRTRIGNISVVKSISSIDCRLIRRR
jgi:hypothetical protein